MLGSLLQSPSGSVEQLEGCPSENIGVYNMSFDFPSDERISELEAVIFAVMLREATDVLEVLRGTLEMGVKPQKQKVNDGNLPPRISMRKPNDCSAKDEKELFFGEDAGFVPSVPSVTDKLLKYLDLTYNVFSKIAYELEHECQSDCLKHEVSTIVETKEKEYNLQTNLRIWSELAIKLRNLEKTFEEEFELEKTKYIDEINTLTKNIESSYCKNREKLDYIMRREASKLEQQNIRLSLREEEVLKQIKDLEKTRSMNAKASKEVQLYWKTVIASLEEDIKHWTTRYNDEMERRQMETTDLEERIASIKEFLEESRELQNERQKVIDVDLAEKQKIEDEKEFWKSIHLAAAMIQAHWRGYMVRHRLGEYAILGYRKKKSKKRSKSKNKKKKK